MFSLLFSLFLNVVKVKNQECLCEFNSGIDLPFHQFDQFNTISSSEIPIQLAKINFINIIAQLYHQQTPNLISAKCSLSLNEILFSKCHTLNSDFIRISRSASNCNISNSVVLDCFNLHFLNPSFFFNINSQSSFFHNLTFSFTKSNKFSIPMLVNNSVTSHLNQIFIQNIVSREKSLIFFSVSSQNRSKIQLNNSKFYKVQSNKLVHLTSMKRKPLDLIVNLNSCSFDQLNGTAFYIDALPQSHQFFLQNHSFKNINSLNKHKIIDVKSEHLVNSIILKNILLSNISFENSLFSFYNSKCICFINCTYLNMFNRNVYEKTQKVESVEFTNCTFRNNRALFYGGALSVGVSNRFLLSNCAFFNNIVDSSFQEHHLTQSKGGAIYLQLFSTLKLQPTIEITNCIFDSNYATEGSEIYFSGNQNLQVHFTIVHNTFLSKDNSHLTSLFFSEISHIDINQLISRNTIQTKDKFSYKENMRKLVLNDDNIPSSELPDSTSELPTPPNDPPTDLPKNDLTKLDKKAIGLVVGSICALLAIVAFVIIYMICYCRKSKTIVPTNENAEYDYTYEEEEDEMNAFDGANHFIGIDLGSSSSSSDSSENIQDIGTDEMMVNPADLDDYDA